MKLICKAFIIFYFMILALDSVRCVMSWNNHIIREWLFNVIAADIIIIAFCFIYLVIDKWRTNEASKS